MYWTKTVHGYRPAIGVIGGEAELCEADFHKFVSGHIGGLITEKSNKQLRRLPRCALSRPPLSDGTAVSIERRSTERIIIM